MSSGFLLPLTEVRGMVAKYLEEQGEAALNDYQFTVLVNSALSTFTRKTSHISVSNVRDWLISREHIDEAASMAELYFESVLPDPEDLDWRAEWRGVDSVLLIGTPQFKVKSVEHNTISELKEMVDDGGWVSERYRSFL